MEEHTLFSNPGSDPELDDAALARYLCGESDATERQWIEQRVRVSEVAKQELALARTAWLASGATRLRGDVERFLKRLRAERARHRSQRTGEYGLGIPAEIGRPLQMRGSGRFKEQPLQWKVWSTALGLAASVVLIALGWFGSAFHLGRTTQGAAMTTYTTNAGQRANIMLPDGSHVFLNVASQLDVPTDFTRGHRTLRLAGEALFTVEHGSSTPFTVTAGATTTRVLGTTFLVRHYATDTATTVVVERGKVAVRSTVVTAQQEVVVTSQGQLHVQSADTTQFFFASGVLALNYTPLARAIPELDRWYDADIRVGDATLAERGIGGRFVAGSLTDLIAMLEWTFDVRVVRVGRVLTLYPRQ